jgi:hypothetical protein
MNNRNLMPIRQQRLLARGVRTRIWAMVLGLQTIALIAATAFVYCGVPVDKAAPAELQHAQEDNTRTISYQREQASALGRFRNSIEQDRRWMQQLDWSPMLAAISQALGNDGMLSDCKIAPDSDAASSITHGASVASNPARPANYMLKLSGMARTQAAVSHIVVRLEDLGVFDRVELIQTNAQQSSGTDAPGVTFQIACLIGGAAKEPLK